MMYVTFTGEGQEPNQPDYLKGSNCLWGNEMESQKVITVEIAKQILKDGEKIANDRFGYEHKFFKVSIEISAKKKATYNAKTNCLRIWENGMPIYENNNGIICKDPYALADCIL